MNDDVYGDMVARSPKEWVASMYITSQMRVDENLYNYTRSQDNSGDKHRFLRSLRASVWSLYTLCRPRMINSKRSKFNVDDIKEMIFSDEENLLKVIDLLYDYLESDLKLTNIANIQDIDRKNVFKSNKISGYN